MVRRAYSWRVGVLAAGLMWWLLGCAMPAATTMPTAAHTATTRPLPSTTAPHAATTVPFLAAQTAIQTTLDRYVQAFNTNNADLLRQIIDPANLPFRRFLQTRMAAFHVSVQREGRIRWLQVLSTTERPDGFVLAHIEAGSGNVADWLFRQVGDQWLLSEPTVEQLGKPQTIVRGRFRFVTYPWADDVNQTVIALFEQAQHAAAEGMGRDSTQPVVVNIKPIYGLTPYENPSYVAYYTPSRSAAGPDTIQVFAPHAYTFEFYDPQVGWETTLRSILTHEYTHMIHTRAFNGAGYGTSWMFEGLADYIAHRSIDVEVRDAVRQDAIIPIIDQVHPVYKQDLMHITTLNQDMPLAYALAQSLVRYIIIRHGGMAGFWKLGNTYDATHDLDAALQQAFHMRYADFDQDWRAWLAEQY